MQSSNHDLMQANETVLLSFAPPPPPGPPPHSPSPPHLRLRFVLLTSSCSCLLLLLLPLPELLFLPQLQGRSSPLICPKPMMHLAYSPIFAKFTNFPYFRKIYVFCLIYFPYFGHLCIMLYTYWTPLLTSSSYSYSSSRL